MSAIVSKESLIEVWEEFKRYELSGDYRAAAREAVRQVVEGQMSNYVDWHIAQMREQWGKGEDRRNGGYARHLLTEMGDVVLTVPRTRQVSGAAVLDKFQRRSSTVDQLLLECFLKGVSTRQVARALLPALGEGVSAQTVSRLAQKLDGVVAAYHRRPLQDRYEVLLLDGVVLKQRTGVGVKKRCVLVALGIRADGRKEVIDFYVATSESAGAWEAFLRELYQRGLTGEELKLVVIDGGSGLRAALPLVYPRVPVQRCWAHKARNVLDKVKRADHPAAKGDLAAVYSAPNRRAAVRAAKSFSRRWRGKYPEAVACLERDLDELLEFYRFPPEWRPRVRTTNPIERRFREVRRRTRPMGVFSDRLSIERILYAVFAEENLKQKVSSIFPLTQNT